MEYSDDDKFLYDKEPPIPEQSETERKVLDLLGAGIPLEDVTTMLLTKILRGERF